MESKKFFFFVTKMFGNLYPEIGKSNWLVGNVMSKRAEDGKKMRIFPAK